METNGINDNQLTDTAGLSNGLIGKAKNSGKAISLYNIEKILRAYPDLSADWLMTGRGTMYNELESTGMNFDIIDSSKLARSQCGETRPRIPLEAAAGSLSIITDSATINDCEQIPLIPTLPTYDFTIIARGASMEPDIYSGDELACRIINSSSFIQWGRIHVIDGGSQGIVVKQLYDGGENIICRSLNSRYHDFLIPKEDVRHIALVIGLIRQF